ncbi:MAG TPA: hypothetical protein PKW35_09180, partial [Nannocystaceae bacterium]|nr:hypothetical protein [Nannocystaceae bacterium]
IAGGAIASVLMVGADLLALHKVRADLERRGYLLDTRPTNLILPTLGGTIVGAIIGYILGHVFGRTSTAPRNFALGGAALGGAYSLHRVLKAELNNLGPLTELALQPIPALPPATRLALPQASSCTPLQQQPGQPRQSARRNME